MENGDGYSTPAARRPPPVREDCWSEAATETLVEAWGERFLELNRGNLRQHHWQEVADAVNARHGHVSKHRRSDVQCKNRIDTLKKKYKAEKARVSDGAPATWSFFPRLNHLLGPSYKPSPVPVPARVPVRPRSKRPAVNFSAMVAVGDRGEDGEESESGKSRTSGGDSWRRRESPRSGYGEVAEAIERLGEIYERVEEERQRHMVELEKQRMKFAKDLEIQRMKLFMESQIQMEKIRQASRNKNKRSRPDDQDGGEGILSSFYCLFDV